MTASNVKTLLSAGLIAAMILAFGGMQFAQFQEPYTAMQIQKPLESQYEKDAKFKVKNPLLEKLTLESDEQSLNNKHQASGEKSSMVDDDGLKLENISQRLGEISAESGKINAESPKIYATTPEEKNLLKAQQQIVRDSNIPYHSLGTDMKAGALLVGFETQEIADEFIPTLNEILSVPYHVEIRAPDVDLSLLHKS